MKAEKCKCGCESYVCDLCRKEQECMVENCQEMLQGFVCTRNKGHAGDHAACGLFEDSHPFVMWKERGIRQMATYNELKEKQVGGSHYKDMKIQPWDFYRGMMSLEEWYGYLLGNILDYLVRAKRKNGLEDLKKAQHLLDVLVATGEELTWEDEAVLGDHNIPCGNCGHFELHDSGETSHALCSEKDCLCTDDTRK